MIDFVIPCYNEEKRIDKSFYEINNYFKNFKKDYNLIFVNDWSSDNTLEKLINLKNKFNNLKIEVLSYEKNMWKWYAVNYWIKKSSWDFIFMMDADIATDLSYIEVFLENIKKYDLIIWTRNSSLAKRNIFKKIFWKLAKIITNIILWTNISDTQCWFKLFKREKIDIFNNLKNYWWSFDIEILYKAFLKNYKIKEIPVKWTEIELSHVKFKDYVKTFIDLIKIKFYN